MLVSVVNLSSRFTEYNGAVCRVLNGAADSKGNPVWMADCSGASVGNKKTQDDVIVVRADHMAYLEGPRVAGVKSQGFLSETEDGWHELQSASPSAPY